MKSQPEGGKVPPGFENERFDVFQANLRWVLAQGFACVVHSAIATSLDAQELALAAVQQPPTPTDALLFDRYREEMSPLYCRGCAGACHDACPEQLAIGPVLRARLYATEYGWHERALSLYERVPEARRWSERCASCSACNDACPWGVDAAGRVREAARLFDPKGKPGAPVT
jgi:predicted aldo/keto reductase-like oxidoreductase